MATRSQGYAKDGKSRDDRAEQEGEIRGNGTPHCIPFQVGDRVCWAVRACGGGAVDCDGIAKPIEEIGHGRISGWLRIEDESYVLVSQPDRADNGADGQLTESDSWEILSERETQIAVLVARGKGTKQIAVHLHITEHTVRSYMRRIFSKLRVRTRPAMVATLMKSGVVLAELFEPHLVSDPQREARGIKHRP
jgi:DNA-binding CsgD family transcriptional regulator